MGKITQVTVMQMYHELGKMIDKGNGDKYLVAPDDNESNSFHGVFFTISPMDNDSITRTYDSQVYDPEKLMIIG